MRWGIMFALLFLAACSAQQLTVEDVATYEARAIDYSDPTSVVAMVNGDPITVADVRSSAIRFGIVPTSENFDTLLENLIVARVISEQADPVSEDELDRRIDQVAGNLSEEELEAVLNAQGLSIQLVRERIREEIAMRDLLDFEVVGPSEEEVRDFYVENAAAFVTPERVVIRHFFVSNATRTIEEQQQLLQGYVDANASERCDYIERNSDATQQNCGLVAISRGSAIPEIEYAAYGTVPGQTRIVSSRAGTHVITVLGVVPATSANLTAATPRIERLLRSQERNRVASRQVSSLLEDAQITIYYSR